MKHFLTYSKTLAIICFCITVAAMFLPVYDGWTGNHIYKHKPFGLIKEYEMPEVGSMSVYNGFGSQFAMMNLFLVFIQSGFILFRPTTKSVPIVLSSVFLLSVLYIYWFKAGWGAPVSDTMLFGYDVMVSTTSVLLILSWILAFSLKPKRMHLDDLLDQE